MASQIHLLLDGDFIVHRATAATQEDIDWGDDITTSHCRHEDVKAIVSALLFRCCDVLGVNEPKTIFCFSSETNFRKSLFADYKGQRTTRKPVGFGLAKQWVRETYDSMVVPDLEADDVMGIMATSGKFPGCVIVSDDKDMMQIPGTLFRPMSGEVLSITKEQGDLFHLTQTLIGDRADNYPGCPGIGEKKAADLLSEFGAEWSTVVRAFEAKGLTEEDALLQARLARILQITEFDVKKKRIKPWNPKCASTAGNERNSPARQQTRQSSASSKRENKKPLPKKVKPSTNRTITQSGK